VFQRALLLHIPARGLCSSPSPSPNKKEKEEDETKQGKKPAADAGHARETVWTTPNLITMSRIAASPLLSWAILEGHYDWAVAGVAVAAATDWLDGYIAKTYNQTVCVLCICVDCIVMWYLPLLSEGLTDGGTDKYTQIHTYLRLDSRC
jgi:hypothetical protein